MVVTSLYMSFCLCTYVWLENKPIESLGVTEIKIPRERMGEREREGGSTQWALVGSQCSHVVNPLVFPKAGNTDRWGAEGRAGVSRVSEP